MGNRVLAFDFGGSSGRAIVGEVNDGKICYEEIARFANVPVNEDGKLRWDFHKLFDNVITALKKASSMDIKAISIDTWGVDYGLLDSRGELIEQPIHYRDDRTVQAEEEVYSVIPKDELYRISGIQPMRINTINQLYAHFKEEKVRMQAKTMLFMPDLFAYMLTGARKAEFSIASTSALLDVNKGEWDRALIARLDLPEDIFCDVIKAGEEYGRLTPEICRITGMPPVPVIAVCSHDTASAIMAVPSAEDSVYISSGTWSLMGVNSDRKVIDNAAFTNEGGYNGSITYLKNIMGLWLMQETKRIFNEQGKNVGYAEMDKMMEGQTLLNSVVNPNAPDFELPCDMPAKIKEYCVKTGQIAPETDGQVVDLIYKSLASCYRYTLEGLRKTFGKGYDAIYMIGGGSKSDTLCRYTADITGTDVYAGPAEATALGNIIVQLIALGDIKDKAEATELIIRGEGVKKFSPQKRADADEIYAQFLSLL